MSKRTKHIILAVALLQIAAILFLLIAPPLVRALPGEVRIRLARIPLGEALLDIGVTPLPTALAAPTNVVARSQIVIPTVGLPTTTATAVPTAVSTPDADSAVTSQSPTVPTDTPTPVPTAVPLPRQTRIEGLKIMPQGFNNCGPANLTINLNFYGNPTIQAEAAAFLKPNREDRNVSPWQMVDYVNEQTNLRAFVGSGGDLELIKRFLANGLPIVIEKGYELPTEGWLGHYLTMFAYDDDKQEFLSLDTNLGPWDGSGRLDSYETVNYYWQQFNYTFFVVYPPEKETLVQSLLGPDMFEREAMWRKAAERAQAEIEADPQNGFAWFNLGTNLTRLGEMTGEAAFYENGAAAFDNARLVGVPPRFVWYQFRPYIAYSTLAKIALLTKK